MSPSQKEPKTTQVQHLQVYQSEDALQRHGSTKTDLKIDLFYILSQIIVLICYFIIWKSKKKNESMVNTTERLLQLLSS